MRCRAVLASMAAGVLAVAGLASVATSSSALPAASPDRVALPEGSFALSGSSAAAFRLPSDVRQVHTTTFPDGRTQTRYQQYVDGASVLGGQITIVRSAGGTAQTVIGAYFPRLVVRNTTVVSRWQAKRIVTDSIGMKGRFTTTYRINPRTGITFYAIDNIRPTLRPMRWVDATSGKVLRSYNGVAHGEGIGVKNDTKQIDTTLNPSTGVYELLSADGRQKTFDVQNRLNSPILMTDGNDIWNLLGNKSPAQQAGVDAHYYANVVDDFYGDTFGRNSIDDAGMQIQSFVHYGNRYCNAFWNGLYMTYGDGDGRTCLSLSGGLDVDGHELTHGVTEHTSNLIYENQSGALNEAFSDMMGNTIEFYADAHGLDPAAQPDWLIGEDVISSRSDPTPGFRNMADPAQDGDPDHMVEYVNTTSDNGGVHTNSGIPNHAYYLAVNGGQNAGCTAGQWRSAPTHTEDCDVTVPAVGLGDATQIFYDGFTSLPEFANFCDARNATVASAAAIGATQASNIDLAWDAVGVHESCTPGVPPPPPCTGSANATIPFGTPHPYGNNGDCRWTYDNGSAGFRFHFSLLDTEKTFDFVYVEDAGGNVLATYTGTHHHGATSPCIPTSTGSVHFTSDQAVTAQGFTVDAVEAC